MTTSLTFPFQLEGGRISSTTDVTRQIEQKIHAVLRTSRLERIGIPSFGAGVDQLLFEPLDDLISADFRVDAMNELVDRVSGIVVLDLKTTAVNDTTADITVFYQLPLSAVRQTTFRIAVPGTLDEESGF